MLKQQGHYYDVAASAYSPDGAYLVTGADDAKVCKKERGGAVGGCTMFSSVTAPCPAASCWPCPAMLAVGALVPQRSCNPHSAPRLLPGQGLDAVQRLLLRHLCRPPGAGDRGAVPAQVRWLMGLLGTASMHCQVHLPQYACPATHCQFWPVCNFSPLLPTPYPQRARRAERQPGRHRARL